MIGRRKAEAATSQMQLSGWVVAHNQHDRLSILDNSSETLSISVAPAAQAIEKAWEIQLLNRLPPLKAGQRYALTFRASGTYSAGFRIKLTLPKPPWTWIEEGPLLELGTRERPYELYYAPSEDLEDVQFQLDLAGADGTLAFHDLRLVACGPRPAVPQKSYMICATPRSGSSWLASLLWNTGAAGRPSESFLHHYARSTGKLGREAGTKDWDLPRDAYLARVIDEGMTPNGVFGTKLMLGYVDTTANWLGEALGTPAARFDQVFEAYFPGARYLHLYRRDKVDQAVSMFIASETDAWRAGGQDAQAPAPTYDAARIKKEYDLLVREDEEWIRRLKGVKGFAGSIAYEDLRDEFSDTIADVFSRLELDPTAYPKPDMTSVKRQTSPLKAEYGARFKADMGLVDTLKPRRSKRFWTPNWWR